MTQARREIALADPHAPHNIDFESSGVYRFISQVRPTLLILIGDFLDLTWASHWNEAVFKQVNSQKWLDMLWGEFDAGKKILKRLSDIVPDSCEKIYIPGNHESWLWHIALQHRLIDCEISVGKFSFKSDISKIMRIGIAKILSRHLRLKDYGFKCLPYGSIYQSGKIHYMHGEQFNNLAATKRLFPGKNLVYGHFHTHSVMTMHNNGDTRKAIEHVCVPGLTGLAPGYLQSGSTTWMNGFWLADVLPSGLFDGRVKKILNGQMAPLA